MRHNRSTGSRSSSRGATADPEGRIRTKREMRRKKTDRSASGPATTTVVVMCLYIANSAPNSVRAVANLEAICKEHLKDNFKLEIIDVLKYPLRALADGVVVTPSLAKLSPLPAAKVIGNLSDESSVLRALGIKG
jgi:circadian clock protein KaiB